MAIANNIAINPAANVVIQASAGTGKTSLLVDRILRLLLEGRAPGSILAITFTRKAAAEIDLRVTRRLFEFAGGTDDAIAQALRALDLDPQPALCARARGLYEALLAAEHGLRAMTFHAFCADILRRFPLEAGVPPNFDLLEDGAEHEVSAWRALMHDIRRDVHGPLAQAMDELFMLCNGHDNARAVLRDFLAHRSDWWAYTEASASPAHAVEYALGRLRDLLGDAADADPSERFISDPASVEALRQYADYLRRINSDAQGRNADRIERLLAEPPSTEGFETLYDIFVTQDGGVRVLKDSKALRSALGGDAERLLGLHTDLAQRLLAAHDGHLRYLSYRQSQAWYMCGQRLLDHFQRLKSEHALLDFSDLEWATYKLLSLSQHAEWVQYKLDQRIDHLLVDEFQDTNPTQWRLLLPLLQEMAAGPERARSVFVVGDEKQSIYRFRRAESELLRTASVWLTDHMQAHTVQQQRSWRSSPAVIDFVNLVFDSAPPGPPLLPGFRPHDTHLDALWGRVEVLPLIPRGATLTSPAAGLRDPLTQPRPLADDERYRRDAERIAATIQSLLGTAIGQGHDVRPLNYGDVFILVRTRAQTHVYEQELRRAAIPYVGAGGGTLLDCLEIQDLVRLLCWLISPYDNHALAWTLHSPLFDCSDADLSALAADGSAVSWFDRLARTAGDPARPRLARAAVMLHAWRAAADKVPVHDLLDRIYNEGNILARYAAATPAHLRARAEANLTRFLELALDVDSGRYPSLARFLAQLEAQRAESDSSAPEIGSGVDVRVRLLTVHAAKGLEAPVVFLADAARAPQQDRGARAFVHWPAEADRPHHFHLIGKKDLQDSASKDLIAIEQRADAREDANLLYVALTRAQQLLYVTGCEPGRGERGWYGHIEVQLARAAGHVAGLVVEQHRLPDGKTVNATGLLQFGTPPPLSAVPAATSPSATVIDPALTRPLEMIEQLRWIYPSEALDEDALPKGAPALLDEMRARVRGKAIHRMLEYLPEAADRNMLTASLRREFSTRLTPEEFDAYWREACAVVEHDAFRAWFHPQNYRQAHNELPVLCRYGERSISGVIDRAVLTDERVILIDYKTHSHAQSNNVAQLAEAAAEQLRGYAQAARRLWPGKILQGYVLFTACREAVEITL